MEKQQVQEESPAHLKATSTWPLKMRMAQSARASRASSGVSAWRTPSLYPSSTSPSPPCNREAFLTHTREEINARLGVSKTPHLKVDAQGCSGVLACFC